MTWYLWKSGSYVNESFIKLQAKTLEEAKKELDLIFEEDVDLHSECLVNKFRIKGEDYAIREAKLFHVDQEIDLEETILAAQKKVKEIYASKLLEEEKQKRYKEYLKLQKEFQV